jgi:hypothetical protein
MTLLRCLSLFTGGEYIRTARRRSLETLQIEELLD